MPTPAEQYSPRQRRSLWIHLLYPTSLNCHCAGCGEALAGDEPIMGWSNGPGDGPYYACFRCGTQTMSTRDLEKRFVAVSDCPICHLREERLS